MDSDALTNKRYQSGVTLIELILSMVIISIAVTGTFSAINNKAFY
ncbi:MAG: prepilin-type N-terminal cleavage/methylation domain-containing protein [Methylobacter sp.]|nr:prepilin-type N-terminal cleavage/methylation domain-containing protein [Methylobacter sp.]